MQFNRCNNDRGSFLAAIYRMAPIKCDLKNYIYYVLHNKYEIIGAGEQYSCFLCHMT